ncbi:MAG: phosphoribosylanthranilate isomerase [Halothiobacillaceae bacterium]|nr:MAG: phosphoribosylanthranilate isomerase [Halothiobacillaceae bacterium]
MRTRIKICGITRTEDAHAAVTCGVDALGLVFYPPSPRHLSIDQAAEIARHVAPFVTLVGLFVDATAAEVEAVLARVPLGLLQFHGDESPEQCDHYRLPYIKAIRMQEGVDLRQVARDYKNSQGLLLDSYQPGLPGGTGYCFDWSRVPQQLDKPLILAGGLTPENVALAIRTTRPYAVDVSGGVEISKGIKDAEKMAAFIKAVESVH